MFTLDAEAFYRVTTLLRHMRTAIDSEGSVFADSDGGLIIRPLDNPDVLGPMADRLAQLRIHLNVLNCQITLKAVEELEVSIANNPFTFEKLKWGLDDIDTTLRRELSETKVFVLEGSRQNYYEPREPLFGHEFETRFPSAAFDLDEAAKSYALGRSTAAAFHLMRVVEIGIRAVACCLQIPEPTKAAARNWGVILKHIKDDGIAKRWATASDRIGSDAVLFEELYASLDAIRNSWRNATMHVEKTYTDDEAEHVFVAVKGFMKKLASRCDELGEPKA